MNKNRKISEIGRIEPWSHWSQQRSLTNAPWPLSMLLSKLCLSCHHQKPRQKPRKGSINTKIRKYSLWLVDHWITDIWVSNLCQAILYIKRKLVLCRMRKRMLPCPIPSILPFSGMLSILGCYQLNVISKDHAENEHGRCGPRTF